jgi:MoaD family protein
VPVTLFIPTALRGFTERNAELSLEAATVGELISALTQKYPDLRTHLLDEKGELRPFVNVFVGEINIQSRGGFAFPLKDGDVVTLIPAIAGGARG